MSRRAAPALLILAALLLLPLLGSFGLWDPQEILKVDVARDTARAPWLMLPERHARPPLPVLLPALGLKLLGTTELAVRLPVALCGLLTLLALYLLGRPLYGARAALLAGLCLLTVPTFFLGARQVTMHIAPALGQLLAVLGLGLLVMPRPRAPAEAVPAMPSPPTPLPEGRGWLPALAGLLAGGVGLAIGATSLGAPLGLSAPLLTVAAALALSGAGSPIGVALLSGLSALALIPALRTFLYMAHVSPGLRLGLAGALAAAGVLLLLLGWRRRTGIAPAAILLVLGCGFLLPLPQQLTGYSPWLGGFPRWPSNREVQIDTVLKPLGFQLFPWSGLLPVALCALVSAGAAAQEARARFASLLPLCWFSITYVLSTYHAALVQEVPFPALCALALAAGLYLDRLLTEPTAGGSAAGVCTGLLVVLIGRDLFFHPELYGAAHFSETFKWPAPLLWVAPVLTNFSLAFGAVLGLGMALSGRPRRVLLYITLGLAVAAAAVTIYGLQPVLSRHVSYRGIYTKYQQLGGGELGVYAVPRAGSKFYDRDSVDLHSVQAVFEFLYKKPGQRAFVLIGAQELAAVDQYAKQNDKTYFVVDDSNVQFLLLSNQLRPGEKDANPLLRLVTRTEPTPQLPLRASFDGKIELLGYDIPPEVTRGQEFVIRLYFKVLQPVGADYRIFMHLEGGGTRWNGDHSPLEGKFPTNYWVPGYYVIDEHRMTATRMGQPVGLYQIWTGFWPGGSGARLKVISGPQDGDNRVKLGVVRVK